MPENVVPMPVLAVRVRRDHVRISFYCLHYFKRVVEFATERMASLTVRSPIRCDLARTVLLFNKQNTLYVGEFCQQESRGGSYCTHSYDCDIVNISHQSSRDKGSSNDIIPFVETSFQSESFAQYRKPKESGFRKLVRPNRPSNLARSIVFLRRLKKEEVNKRS